MYNRYMKGVEKVFNRYNHEVPGHMAHLRNKFKSINVFEKSYVL